MLVEQPEIRARLRGVVRGLAQGVPLQEDLLQEALLHLWLIEANRPEMTLAWYLTNCAFHVHHLLSRGHSLDAPKRRHLAVPLETDTEDTPRRPEIPDPTPGPFEHSSANDLLHQTAIRLSPGDKKILILLAENSGLREIASLLGLSHVAVIKARVRIARVLSHLG